MKHVVSKPKQSQGTPPTLRNAFLACVGIFLAYVVGGYLMLDTVLQLIKGAANPFFAVLIIATTLVGQALTIYHAYKIWGEFQLVNRMKQFMGSFQLPSESPEERVQRAIGSASNGRAAWGLFNFFRHASPTSGSFDQQALRTHLQVFEEQVERRSVLVGHIANNLIGLGLFGTFLGLIVTLKEVGSLIGLFAVAGDVNSSDMMGQFFQRMSGPLAGMGEAFVASLLGLGGSMINGLQMLSLKKMQSATLMEAETTFFEAANTLYDLEGQDVPTLSSDVSSQSAAQIQLKELASLRSSLEKQTDAILMVASKMRQATETMAQSVEMMERLSSQEEIRPRFDRMAAILEQRLESVVRKLDDSQLVQHNLLSVAKDNVAQFNDIGKHVQQILHHSSNGVVELGELRQSLINTSVSSLAKTQEQAHSLQASIRQDLGGLASALNDLQHVLREQAHNSNEISSNSKETNAQLAAMQTNTKQLFERIQPQIVEVIARLEKTEIKQEQLIKYDWNAIQEKLQEIQASMSSMEGPRQH